MDAIGDADSEWEYEYDENETEDFYIVLELPSAPATISRAKSKADELFAPHDPTNPRRKPGAKTGKRSRKTAAEEEDDEAGNRDTPLLPTTESNEVASTQQQPVVQGLQDLNIAAAASKAAAGTTNKGLQIMDFESEEPAIMYQGQMYSCQWASSVGSDLLFMRRPEDASQDYKPLRAFRDVDMLGITAAKLVASHATIERKPDYMQQADLTGSVMDQDLTIEHEAVVRKMQFLSRLADVKEARGEFTGNLKAFADGILENPERIALNGKNQRGGRTRAALTPRIRPPTAQSRAGNNAAVETPTIASTRARRSSTRSAATPTPVTAGNQEDEEMPDA